MDQLKATSRYSFVGGPFGSNLTRNDYIDTEGVPVIRGTNLGGETGRFVEDGFVYVSEDKADSLLQNLAYPGDLIFTQRGTLGQVVEIPKTSAHQRFVVSQSQMKLTVNPEKACPRFIFHFFRSPGAVNTLNQRIQATGVPHINLEILKSFPVILPPLPEQRRIAAILDKADAIRRKREEGIRLTEELLRSTFLEMFGDPATNPKRWAMEKLGELASIRRGSSPRPIENYMGGDVPWIKIGDATKGDSFYITETEDYVTKAGAEKSVLLEPGSLVVANSGVSLGFARILKIKGCVHDGWLSLEKLDDRLNKIYLLRLINSLTDHFRAIAPEGTQPNLNTGIMKNFRVAIPPIDLQRKFERSAYGIVELSAARKKAAIEAEALFGSIVQRAFRGELTSKGDE